MIDIHTHILPSIDDGAQDLKESIELLQTLAKQGVTEVIATPHVIKGTYDNTRSTIDEQLNLLKNAIIDNNIEMKIYPGAELYLDTDTVENVKANNLTLASSRYVLVESSFQKFPNNFEGILFHLQQEGYEPIIAHAERFHDFNTNFNYLVTLLNRGFYVQVNCGSLFGEIGERIRKFALKLLEQGCIHFLASDLHGLKKRPLVMDKTYNFISENFSEELAELLMVENPSNIINNKPIKSMISDVYWEKEEDASFLSKVKKMFS